MFSSISMTTPVTVAMASVAVICSAVGSASGASRITTTLWARTAHKACKPAVLAGGKTVKTLAISKTCLGILKMKAASEHEPRENLQANAAPAGRAFLKD